jgi:hypothetical protein
MKGSLRMIKLETMSKEVVEVYFKIILQQQFCQPAVREVNLRQLKHKYEQATIRRDEMLNNK